MSTLLKQKTFLFLHLVIFLISTEISLFRIIYNLWIPEYFLLELGVIIILSSIIYLFKSNVLSIIYSVLIFGISIALYVVNINLDYASGDILTLAYLLVLGEALEVASSSFIYIYYIIFTVLLAVGYIITLIYFIIFIGRKKDPYKIKYYPMALVYAFFIISIGIITRNSSLNDIKKDNQDNSYYNTLRSEEIISKKSISLKKGSLYKHGMLTHFISELINLYFKDDSNVNKEIDDYIKEGNQNEENSYSGILKDMNVLEIMIESAPSYVLSEELTPNLYKLTNEGIYFENNLSKNKTNHSELIGMLGSAYQLSDKEAYKNYPYGLPKILSNSGYKTTFFHDNDPKFYHRGDIMNYIGFEKTYFHNDFYDTKVEFIGNMPFDTTFVEDTIDLMIPDEKFYTYYTTIATHGPYNSSEESLKKYKEYVGYDGIKYYDKLTKAIEDGSFIMPTNPNNPYVKRYSVYNFKDEEERKLVEEQLIHFELEIMNFDEALGLILDKLEKENKLDNTLIILYGDHDAYYTSNHLKPLKYYVYGAYEDGNYLEEYPNQYETYMCFYNPILNEKYKNDYETNKVEMQTSPSIIVPTILDLLGYKYNTNLYLSSSIFSSTMLTNLVYSYEIKTVFTDKIMAIDYNTFSYKNTDDLEYINTFNIEFLKLLKKNEMIEKMYKNRYFG